jgi:hypothetical protein
MLPSRDVLPIRTSSLIFIGCMYIMYCDLERKEILHETCHPAILKSHITPTSITFNRMYFGCGAHTIALAKPVFV